MNQETSGTVISSAKQWWFKVNTKPVRSSALDGATFPYIIKVSYSVNGTTYIRRKWVSAGNSCPSVGSTVVVLYSEDKPSKGKILL